MPTCTISVHAYVYAQLNAALVAVVGTVFVECIELSVDRM